MDQNHDNRPEEGEDDDWPPQEHLDALLMERSVNPDETDLELTYRIFEENAPTAATNIVHLASHDPSSKIRFEASKYIVERVLGRIGDLTAVHHAITVPKQIGDKVADVLERVASKVQLTPEQQQTFNKAAEQELKELAAAAPASGDASE